MQDILLAVRPESAEIPVSVLIGDSNKVAVFGKGVVRAKQSTLAVANDWIERSIYHFFDCNQFGDIREVHISSAVYSPHPPYPKHSLDEITFFKRGPSLKLLAGCLIVFRS